ncbi:MAG: nitroreductase family protein [Candidatus Caldatribacteriota bacterium]|nr:nitroreductase family protein [Candidatus Caldatribacteriota bacterium]
MVLEAIKKRQSVRSYQDKEIPEEILQQILEAGRLAPSAKNSQPYKFIIVKDKKLKEKLIPACKNQGFVGEASVVIVGCAVSPGYKMGNGDYSYSVDLAIALDHMGLQAVALGLGTCWIGAFYQDKVKEVLEVPEDINVVALMPLGHPKELGAKRGRKPLSEIVCYDKYKG